MIFVIKKLTPQEKEFKKAVKKQEKEFQKAVKKFQKSCKKVLKKMQKFQKYAEKHKDKTTGLGRDFEHSFMDDWKNEGDDPNALKAIKEETKC